MVFITPPPSYLSAAYNPLFYTQSGGSFTLEDAQLLFAPQNNLQSTLQIQDQLAFLNDRLEIHPESKVMAQGFAVVLHTHASDNVYTLQFIAGQGHARRECPFQRHQGVPVFLD